MPMYQVLVAVRVKADCEGAAENCVDHVFGIYAECYKPDPENEPIRSWEQVHSVRVKKQPEDVEES